MSLKTCPPPRVLMKKRGRPPSKPLLPSGAFVKKAMLQLPQLPLLQPLLWQSSFALCMTWRIARRNRRSSEETSRMNYLLPGKLARAEGQPPTSDKKFNEAYDN